MKNRKLNQWLWKWHFIAGIISLPFVLVLSITGAIYLFKPTVEKEAIAKVQQIENNQKPELSYQKQWDIAQSQSEKPLNSMILLNNKSKATEFISGRFGGKKSLFVNKYTGDITGTFQAKDTWMYSIRKLHGELLGGSVGTKIVELIASWMVVLIITGLYIWFPFQQGGFKNTFKIRIKEGKRLFFRDLHAVTGFWISLLLLLVLAGGFPWTDVFGANFKWVQKATNTGYPATWSGRGLSSTKNTKQLSLDDMVVIANKQNLEGTLIVGLPKNDKSTFSVSNKTANLSAQKMIHFDQYSGAMIKSHNWSDVGILMRGRMWVMAFHQGEFGGWNWWLMFGIAILLTVISLAAICSYWLRKPVNSLGIPKVPKHFSVDSTVLFLIVLLGIIFPLFGASVVVILLFNVLFKKKKKVQV